MLKNLITFLQKTLSADKGLVMVVLAVVVGAATGLAAVFFIHLIASIQIFVFSAAQNFLPFLGAWSFVLVPVLGALIVGPIIAFWASEAKGHGVPEVMQALVLRGGRIRPRVALAKIAASAICIGTGGSAGREGPIIQVGSALGSSIGQFLGLNSERIKNLVACGAAAGIAATFNAPIAGVAFASEVLLSELQVGMFGNVVIAAVSASIVSQIFLGSRPAFEVPSYTMHSPWEILLYVLLGLLAAIVGIMFIRMLNSFENIFDNWDFPPALKPAVGALLLGLLGYVYLRVSGFLDYSAEEFRLGMPLIENIPHVFGSGFTFIEKVLQGKVSFLLLAALIVLKPLATSFTLGSGNSGGVFAPSLFTGAMLGGAFGYVVQYFFPEISGETGAYALVGMAAVFAAAARAPFTSMLIVFEMSNDYHLILPLMAAGMVASTVAHWLHPDSIYTMKLTKKGIKLEQGRDLDVMQGVRVEEVMYKNPVTVHQDQSVAELFAAFQENNFNGFPVMADHGKIFGMVTLHDLEKTLEEIGDTRIIDLKIKDVARPVMLTVFPDEPVWSAIRKMTPNDLPRLPVVSREDERLLVGQISRSDILRAYEIGLMRKQQTPKVSEQMSLRAVKDMEFIDIKISSGSPCLNKCVAEIKLPHGVNLISIERADGTVYIPHGGTRILNGDQITLLTRVRLIAEVRKTFEG
ncbi:MAG: chloride channel protein [Proteobacteria bacterium]|nr:chloride channel protein [Pseudomonadota bacterium]MBU1717378.1 chloride channel protein [Pseudomonadota bacterium]